MMNFGDGDAQIVISRAVEISPGVPLVSAALKCTVAKAAGDGDDVSDHPTLNSSAFAK
jgi:hypothetical protein